MDDPAKVKLKVQIWITAILGLTSLGLIIYLPGDDSKVKWAYGIIGIIIGYWLK